MKLAIMQPYFFPYIGYFQLIYSVDKIILYDHLHYIKQGWINRNRILEIHKKDTYITVPLQKCSSNKLIDEIEIDNTAPWQRRMCKAINYNYKKSPFFDELYPVIEELIVSPCRTICELNFRIIEKLSALLEIPATIVYGSGPYLEIESDLQKCPPSPALKTQRIFSICRQEKADVFINAVGGRALYEKSLFREKNIDLYFIQTLPFSYPQSSPVFHPDLSIVDVLLNCGLRRTRELLALYKLV